MGGPGYLEKALKSIQTYIVSWFIASGFLLLGAWWVISTFLSVNKLVLLAILACVWLAIALIMGAIVARQVSKPLKAVSQAVMHVSPSPLPIAAPDIEKLHLAKDLVTNLVRQIYDFASQAGGATINQASQSSLPLQQLPIAVFGIDQEANITFSNPKSQEYAGTSESLAGKNLYNQFDILFRTEETLEDWIENCRAKSITAQKIWHGVRMSSYGEETKYCDLAASYIKQSGNDQTEVILTIFDETDNYSDDEQEISFVALAVHELRTPLTILKGYIEVLEDELGKDLNPEMKDFMQKMKVAADNLTAFVGNILNIARIEQDQLSLKLSEEDWKETLSGIVANMQLRAQVHGKTIELSVPDGLPKVGIDKISIAEVVINLLDNAIKYSPKDKTLIRVLVSVTKDNLIETVVQDYGVGIPETVVPHLFERYSRNHRNRAAVAGTGLGLYLSKALVAAHGGNIWVKSKEGEGTIIGFTVLPYSQLAEEVKSGDNKTITRNAHGWIKNHSLSRR